MICPVYNTNPQLIREATISVLEQSGSHDIELIIVDDGSVNLDTINELSKISVSDKRINLIVLDKNVGPSIARQTGVENSKYEWIGFIDADDLWPLDKLEESKKVLEKWPDSQWICGNYVTLLNENKLTEIDYLTSGLKDIEVTDRMCRLSGFQLTKKLVSDWLPLGSSILSKELIKSIQGFDARLRYGEDWLLFLRLSTISSADYIHSNLYILRRQGLSMMRSPGRMSASYLRAGRIARRDPNLVPIARQLRWKRYGDYKDIAMNSAINGNKVKGLLFSVGAFLHDPREAGELFIYIRALFSSQDGMRDHLRRYSSAEQVDLAKIAEKF